MPVSKGDALKTLSAVKTQDDSKSELSEEELAGLSALMAMLPHQQTATPVASGATGNGLTAKSTLNAAALSQNGAGQQSMSTLLAGHEKAQQASTYQAQAQNADPSQPVNAPRPRSWPPPLRSRISPVHPLQQPRPQRLRPSFPATSPATLPQPLPRHRY